MAACSRPYLGCGRNGGEHQSMMWPLCHVCELIKSIGSIAIFLLQPLNDGAQGGHCTQRLVHGTADAWEAILAVEIASLPRPLRRIHQCDRFLQHGISGHQKCFEDLVGQRSSSGPFLLPKTSRENEMNPSICSGTPPFQDGVSKPFPLSYAATKKKKNFFLPDPFIAFHDFFHTDASSRKKKSCDTYSNGSVPA